MTAYIEKGKRTYKANLHCHSVLSDGKLTPEQLKQAYRSRGYDILAITDHERPYDHSALTERDFLMLTGYEAYIRTSTQCVYDPFQPEIHINLFAEDPHNVAYIHFNESYCKYIRDPAERQALKKVGSQEAREYSVPYINRFVDTARKNGYICSYNHPVWSMEDVADIRQYEGFFSMEMCNYGCFVAGRTEYNGALYDDLLRRGKHWCVHGSDDNHNRHPFDSPYNDSFGAFTVVLAESLTYESVIEALKTGRFYSSMGPLFRELTFDGRRVHVETDAVRQITMHFGSKDPVSRAGTREQPVTSADFVIPDRASYIRVSAVDFEGRYADTRGFFREEWESFR